MNLRYFSLALLLIVVFGACTNEKVKDNTISHILVGKNWTVKNNKIYVDLYNNVLNVSFYSENDSQVTASTSFAIHDPSTGSFVFNRGSKHGFVYSHSSYLNPSYNPYFFSDELGTISISKMDLSSKTISLKILMRLDSKNVKDQLLEVNMESVPMNVIKKSVGYARYYNRYSGYSDETNNFLIDSLSKNTIRNYHASDTWGAHLACLSSLPIVLKTYTRHDASLNFSVSSSFLIATVLDEYNLSFTKADNTGVHANFNATSSYVDYPNEKTYYTDGYFEMYTE